MSKELKLERTREQWAISDPKVIAKQSPVAIMYALQDAKRDIETLHRALEKASTTHPAPESVEVVALKAENERLKEALEIAKTDELNSAVWAAQDKLRAILEVKP